MYLYAVNLSSLALSLQWPSAMYRDRIEFELVTLRFLGVLNDLTLYPHLPIGHVFSRLKTNFQKYLSCCGGLY